MKILGLLKKWGERFASYTATIPNFTEIYQNLLKSGVVFPNSYSSNYEQYIQNSNVSQSNFREDPPRRNPPIQNYDYSNDFQGSSQGGNRGGNEVEFDYVENIKFSLNPSKFEPKYTKLVNYLIILVENIGLANEIIDNMQPGESDDSLKDVMASLRSGNNRLIETISSDRLKNEKLMDLTLGVDEDINRTLTRYEHLKNRQKPDPFLSSFVEKNAMNDIPMVSKSKSKSSSHNYAPSNQQSSNNPGLNIKPDPDVKSVNDLFDIFSNPQPVNQPQNNFPGNNIDQHPLDFFDNGMQPTSINLNPNMGNNMMGPGGMNQPKPQPNPTADLQSKLQQIYSQPQNPPMNNIYPNLSVNVGNPNPNPMMNNPMMNNPNPMMNNPNPNPMMNNPNPMINNPNPMMNNPNPMMNNPNPMINNPNPMMNNPNPMMNNPNFLRNNPDPIMNNPNPLMSNPMMSNPNPMMSNPEPMMNNQNMGMPDFQNQNQPPKDNVFGGESNMNLPPASINLSNPQQGNNLIYPSVSGIGDSGSYPNFNQGQPMPNQINRADEEKLKAIDSLF